MQIKFKNQLKKVTLETNSDRLTLYRDSFAMIRPATSSSNTVKSTLPFLKNIASVAAPQSQSSTGDVQATSVAIKDSYAYVSYNMVGTEVFGALDVINVSNPEQPYIEATFTTIDSEFSDLKIVDNTLYAIGYQKETKEASSSAVLLVFDVSTKNNPILKKTIKVAGTYAISLDTQNNKLLVSTGTVGGYSLYDILDKENPVLLETKVQSNVLYSKFGYNTIYQLSGDSSTALNDLATNTSKVIANTASEAPSRFSIQNSLLYINNSKSKKLHILDLSDNLKEISTLSIEGTANGIAHDQQKLYLASGEKGFVAVDVSNPNMPETIGSLYFDGENGSANNIWIQKTSNSKLYFLADGRQGLRILKENIINPTPKTTISFFARGINPLDIFPIVDLKLNNTIIHKFTIDNSTFKVFNYELDQPVSPTDKIEFVFNNWTSSKQIIMPYIQVNGLYCYVTTSTTKDFGLLTQYQSIGFVNNNCSNGVQSYQCDPGSTKSCNLNHLQGVSSCSDAGAWSSCNTTNQCENGYFLSANGECTSQVCTPNSTTECSDANGSGLKTCAPTGSNYGACIVSRCNTGFTLQNNTCVQQICEPNSSSSCLINHKNGLKTCSTNGLSESSCIAILPISCESSFYLSNGECLPTICSPNSTTSCFMTNGVGAKQCNSIGSAFGSCAATACNPGYFLENGLCSSQICEPNTTTQCFSNHINGVKTCNTQGSNYSACITGSTCESGYFYSNGSCLAQTCTPGINADCVSNHILGSKTCNSQGSDFGSCQLTTNCESGYSYSNNSCQIITDTNQKFYVLAGSSINLSVEFSPNGLIIKNSMSESSLNISSSQTNSKLQISSDLKKLLYSPITTDHGKQIITLKAMFDGALISIPVTINVMTPFSWTGANSNILDQNAKNNFCGAVNATNSGCTGLSSLNYDSNQNLLYTLKPGTNLYGNVLNDNVYYQFILDDTCTTNCNVQLKTNLYTRGLWLRSNSFTQNQYNITYSGSGVVLENQATFNGGSGSLSVPLSCGTEALGTSNPYYDFSCSNSTFNSSKMVRIGGNFTVSSSCTFNHTYADDTLRFVSNTDTGSSCSNWLKKSTIIVPNNFSVNNLEFTGDNPTYDLSNKTITVAGNLLFEDKNWNQWNRGTLINGTLDVKGNLQLMDVRSVGNLLVKMTGSNNQSISCPIVNFTHGSDYTGKAINDYYCMIPQLEINKSGGILTGTDYLRLHNKFNYVAGSVDFSKMIGMFGDLITGYGNYSITPSWTLPSNSTTIPANISVVPVITSEWYNGYNYQITITNNTGTQISDWKLCFNYNHSAPSSIWNALFDSTQTTPNWILNPQSYNHVIYPGSNVTLGWQGAYPINGDKISNLKLLINGDSTKSCSQNTSLFKTLYTTTNMPPNSIWY